MYEDTPKEEDSLAASPVKVAYPSPACGESPAEDLPAEEHPITEEASPAEESYSAEEAPSPADDPYDAVDEAPPPAEEPYDAAEETPSAEEPPAAEEVPAESEAVEQTDVPIGSRAEDSDGEGANVAEKLGEQAGEVVLICTSCTTMILIEYDGPCPYSIKSLMGSNYDSYSWLLHTTCLSCVSKHKDKLTSRDSFGNECMAAFSTAILSEEFMKQSRWFEVADSVCRKPTRIAMDEGRRSVGYAKIDMMREESTVKCRIKGFRSGKKLGKEGLKNEAVESFMPGGFL